MMTRSLVSSVLLWVTICVGLPLSATAQKWNDADYADVLSQHVNRAARVNYSALKAHPTALNRYVAALGNLDPNILQSWTPKDQEAFWINAYNALTLKAVIDHYPIQTSWPAKLRFPANSIQQIPGFKNKLSFRVTGRQMTLDGIQHNILRTRFKDPRIHIALCHGAIGAPRLLDEPYNGMTLDKQLDRQVKRFIKDPHRFRIAWQESTIYLSQIFKWFGEDCIGVYESKVKPGKLDEKDRAILSFFYPYLMDKDQAFLEWGKAGIQYIKYDWSLNDQ